MKKITIFIFSLFVLHSNAQFTDYVTDLGTTVGMAKSGNTLFIGSIGESKILTVDMSAPIPVAQDFITGISFPTKLIVLGNELYFTYGLNNVGKIDLTAVSPQLEFVVNVPGAFGITQKDNYIYVSNRNDGQILRFDYTVPSPTLEVVVSNLGSFINDIAFNGNDLYIARGGDNLVSKVDVNTPNAPVIDIVEASGVLEVAFNGNDLYYSNTYLNRIDIGTTAPNPEILASNVSQLWDILFNGNAIFLAQQVLQKIITTDINNLNPITFTNNSFALDEIASNNLPTLSQGATALADVDGDSDLDLFVTGNNLGTYIAKLYLNDGTGIYTESVSNVFEGVSLSSVEFADIDGDNDQDLLYSGFDNAFNRKTKLYINDGLGNFTDDGANTFVGITSGSHAFADVDSDSDLDLILSGEIGATGYTQLFINDGNGSFSEASNNPFPPLASSAIAFSDIDNDNDLDLLAAGFVAATQTNTTQLYTNDGNGNFSLVANTPFPDVVRGMLKFVDLDGDLDEDLIFSGQFDNANFGSSTQTYTNDGNGNFSFTNSLINVQNGSIGTTDIDGDGDIDVLIGGLETIGAGSFESTFNLYFNDGNGNLLKDDLFSLEGIYEMDYQIIADIDNDNDDDILLFSRDFNSAQLQAKVYRNVPDISEIEKNALNALYFSTNGNAWSNNTNWNTRFAAGMWYGVTTTENNVTQLNIFGENGLNGTLPEELGDLSNLELINISLNANLTGPIPNSIGNLTNLIYLGLQWNSLTGAIPNTIGNLSQLQELRLLWNDLSGTLPSSIGNLTNLGIMELDGANGNNFSGTLPNSFGNLTNLTLLSIGNNNLEGTLPSSLENLTNLTNVILTNNNLTGTIPFNSPIANIVIDNNLYDFSDLEPFINAGNYNSIIYSPQRTTDLEEDINSGAGETIILSVTADDINRNAPDAPQNNLFQWYKDNTAISEATNASYEIINAQESDSGVYYCEITNPLVPDLTIVRAPITLIVEESLSVETSDKQDLKLYPNPASNWINLQLEQTVDHGLLSIYDVNGRLVKSKDISGDRIALNIETLSNGIYVLTLEEKNTKQTIRFIKQ